MLGGRSLNLVAIATAGLLAVGCGSDEEESGTPVACLVDGPEYVAALASAPGAVELDGTPIGDCLPDGQGAGPIADVGEAMLDAARRLNREARRQPLGEASVQLGYLVGVVDARAEDSGGIHTDLALNVEQAALYIPGDEVLPGGFQQRYEEGLAAGRSDG